MGFRNPYDQMLKDDVARRHWEDHVLIQHPKHVAFRREKAARKIQHPNADEVSFEAIENVRRQDEEEMFQRWYELKKRSGFAQFEDPFSVDDDYSE